MNLRFDTSLTEGYKSASQIARILTEDWLARIAMQGALCGILDHIFREIIWVFGDFL